MISTAYAKLYTKSLYWNLLDSGGSQFLLILFHILLRSYVGPEIHGSFSTLISLFYLLLSWANLGLDYSLAPFFAFFTQSKQHARSFFIWYLVPQFLFLIVITIVVHFSYTTLLPIIPFLKAIPYSPLPLSYALLLGLSFISEGIRKTIKTVLQLAFKVEVAAVVEFFGMAGYVAFICMSYQMGLLVDLTPVWIGFLATSVIQTSILALSLAYFYSALNHDSRPISFSGVARRFWLTRFFTFGNQAGRQLFPSNLLVPLSALYLGLNQASLLKVATSISHWITLIAQKVFGVSSTAVLAHSKTLSMEDQRGIFSQLSYYLNQALYFLLIFLLINGKKIALLQILETPVGFSWSPLYALILLSFAESLFVLYERWFITQEKSGYLFCIHVLGIIGLYASMKISQFFGIGTSLSFLMSILASRMSIFLFAGIYSYYHWGLLPSLKISKLTLSLALVLAIAFFLLF